jgi:hypothetical protein
MAQTVAGFAETVLPITSNITVAMAKGFTLCMLKTVMDGRSDDLIDLATASLCQQ